MKKPRPQSEYVDLFGDPPVHGRPSEPFVLTQEPLTESIRQSAGRRALRVLRAHYPKLFLSLLDEEICFLNWKHVENERRSRGNYRA